MKNFYSGFLISILVWFNPPPKHTVIIDLVTKVKIHDGGSWLSNRVQFTNCDSALFFKTTQIVLKCLRKYPSSFFKRKLKNIYIYKSILVDSVSFGGTFDDRDIYISQRDGIEYIENIFHHEFLSILVNHNGGKIKESHWYAINQKRFKYSDPTGGYEYLKIYKTSIPCFDTAYLKEGFLSNYSKSSIDNDMSRFAENLFLSTPEFWAAVDKFDAVRKKATLLINFYHKLNPIFTETYFRQLK